MTTATEMFDAAAVHVLPARERVGLVIDTTDARQALAAIVAAEQAGVRQIWTTQGPGAVDALTTFAVAATQTSTIRLGTAILPTYPRHPLAVAAQVLAFNEIAPGRLRLGVGPSHRPIIEGMYGIEMKKPLAHTREFVEVLRLALSEGHVEYRGDFYTVKATLPATANVPILTATLGPAAFKAAGEISDGALSWMAPVPYLLQTGLPALQEAAKQRQRLAPPLVAHVPVVLGKDRSAVITAARKRIDYYGKLPFYAHMFAESGYPVAVDGTVSDALIDNLVVSGDDETVSRRLHELLASGLDELLLLSIPVQDAEQERTQLAHIIGQL